MAFTRSMLEALGIESNKIQAIIDAHMEVVTPLKQERDTLRTENGTLKTTNGDLEKQIKGDGKDYKQLYTDLVAANEKAKTHGAKVAALREIAKAAKIGDAYIDTVIEASGKVIDTMELVDGKAKNAEQLQKDLGTKWAALVTEEHEDGPEVKDPPGGQNGGKKDLGDMSMEEYIAARKKK